MERKPLNFSFFFTIFTHKTRCLVLCVSLLQLFFMDCAYADFTNGGFEDTYTPSSNNAYNPINGWTLTGYTFNGNLSTAAPTSMNSINLSAGTTPGGISDIISGTAQTLYDWFLYGATPTPTFLLPIAGSHSVMVNLRSVHQPFTVAGTSSKPTGWTHSSQQATSISQQFVVQNSDVDSNDGKVHIRFIAVPVLENPSHPVNEQPFIAVQLNNITTGNAGANPLYFQWSYSSQPGVPWKTLSAAGSNSGSNTSYQYTDMQAFDIAPGNAYLHVGDTVELVLLASGCSAGGHDGHLYLDSVQTSIPSSLWVAATGPISSTLGNNITYTYTYINNTSSAVNNVQVIANLPLQGTPSSLPASSTTFVSVTTPTTGVSPSCSGTGPVTCTIGTLQAGQTGTFQLTVNIPSNWATSTGPVNNGNYPISGQGLDTLLGPLVQTQLLSAASLSNLVVDASGLPTTAMLGQTYAGTFSCTNNPIASASGTAPSASCDITNLPTGLSVTGCTITPSTSTWIEPASIPSNQTVTCSVSGTPTTASTFMTTVTANAANSSNSTTNYANVAIAVSSSGLPAIPATLNGSPVLNLAVVCCGRPVVLGTLAVPGTGATTYTITASTEGANCLIGNTGLQTYLKIIGKSGSSCTIVGTKDGITSMPFTVVVP